MDKIKLCEIRTFSGRDYYTVGVLDYYWESILKHLGDSVELVSSESKGNKFKRLIYTVEVKNITMFEKLIQKSALDNWVFKRNYSVKVFNKNEKKRKAQNKVDELRKELREAEESLRLF